MKANEAPDKIYIHEASAPELTEKLPYHIEYIRKDALIEKACNFIKERLFFEDSWHTEGEDSILVKVIKDFKKYMEG